MKGLFFCIIIGVFLLSSVSVSAELQVLYADSLTATRGVTNESLALGAFDDQTATLGTWQSTGDIAVMAVTNFTQNGSIQNVTFSLRLNDTVGQSDDLFSLQYSNDSGITWFILDNNLTPPETLVTLGNYTVYSSFKSVDSIQDMQVRIFYMKHQGPDRVTTEIDGLEVYVTYLPPDTESPNVTLVWPANNSLVNATSVSFNFTPTDNRGFTNCTLYINGSLNQTNQTVIINNTENTITTFLQEGTWRWNVTCADTSNNTGTSEVEYFVTVDVSAPEVNLTGPANNSVIYSSLVDLFYNVTDRSNIDFCELIINNTVNATISAVVRNDNSSFSVTLPNGNYTWGVNCTDALGWEGGSETRLFSVFVFLPEITLINSSRTVVLNAGTTKLVECNVSVYDEDGADTILYANATFFLSPNSSNSPDNNLSHYSNSSCSVVRQFENSKDFVCGANAQYYARNGTWQCNVTAVSGDGVVYENTSFVVDPLYALNVSLTLFDFGDLETGQESPEIEEPITNLGNQIINVAVQGYGETPGDGKSFACATQDIPAANTRVALTGMVAYEAKTPLSAVLSPINLTISPQNNEFPSMNSTWWQTRVPENLTGTGECNGSIVFHVWA